MPNFRVDYKVAGRIQEKTVVADDIDDAREQVLSKFPGATITGVKQRGVNQNVQHNVPTPKRKGGLGKLIGLLFVLVILGIIAAVGLIYFGLLDL